MTTTKSGKKLKVQNLLLKLKLKLSKGFEHLSRHSTIYAVLLTFVVVLLAVFVLEPPQDPEPTPQVKQNNSVIQKISDSELLGQFQNFGIILVAIIYILERPKRRKQAELQAWQLIDGARGSETSGARFRAIQELHEMGVSLKGLDADGADLIGINLKGANLERASFKNALLQGANLEGANLKNAQLQKAKLQGANLKGVDFEGANLEGSELNALEHTTYDKQNNEPKEEKCHTDLESAFLRGAHLQGAFLMCANLKGAKFYNADLSGADFYGATLDEAEFENATLNGTRFGDTHLTLEQVNSVEGWKNALYEKSFCDQNPTMDLSPDELDNSTKENDVDKNRKIVSHEMLHNIAALLKEMETNNSVSLQENLIVKDLKTALESLIENEKSHEERSATREAQWKRLGIKFDKTVAQRNKVYEDTEQHKLGAENEDSKLDEYKKPYRLASQWLESNREIILNSKGVEDYLDRYSSEKTLDGVLDSKEQLKIDIDNCLMKICYSMYKVEKLGDETTDLNAPSPIVAEALKVIIEKVIPEEKKRYNNLSDKSYGCIKLYFGELIDKLYNKSDCSENKN